MGILGAGVQMELDPIFAFVLFPPCVGIIGLFKVFADPLGGLLQADLIYLGPPSSSISPGGVGLLQAQLAVFSRVFGREGLSQ